MAYSSYTGLLLQALTKAAPRSVSWCSSFCPRMCKPQTAKCILSSARLSTDTLCTALGSLRLLKGRAAAENRSRLLCSADRTHGCMHNTFPKACSARRGADLLCMRLFFSPVTKRLPTRILSQISSASSLFFHRNFIDSSALWWC